MEELQAQLAAAELAQQQLQQQLELKEHQTEARLSAAADALTAATAEIEQLSAQLLQAQQLLEQHRADEVRLADAGLEQPAIPCDEYASLHTMQELHHTYTCSGLYVCFLHCGRGILQPAKGNIQQIKGDQGTACLSTSCL